jgi:hypothetical protein
MGQIGTLSEKDVQKLDFGMEDFDIANRLYTLDCILKHQNSDLAIFI